MTRYTKNGGGLRGRAKRWVSAALVATPLLTACTTDELLKVDAPSLLPADRFQDPGQAALLVNGAIADFECAYASTIMVEGLIADEFADAQLGAASWDYDRRSSNQDPGGDYGTQGCTSDQRVGLYAPVSTARWSADNVLKLLQAATDQQVAKRDSLTAAAALYAGFSYALLGQSMCEAAIDLGPRVNQQALFKAAEDKFTIAIDAATKGNVASLKNAALVGRARVRLYQGNKTGADADAKLVPAGFVYNATYSEATSRRYNRVYSSMQRTGFYTIEPASRNLTTEGRPDPRVAMFNTGVNGADRSQIWMTRRYTSNSSPIPIATWEEAQLIIAEAEGGQAAISAVNALRDKAGLPHYSGATDAASIQSLIVDERRKALFAMGVRNYDIQRFNLPFNPAVGAPFGKGGTYGNTTCLPLPNIEKFNNPNV
ncbi:MAG TPA: hypothetical protein VFQ38_19755 [Longimicrobiales bacterium]|nr:hypothetical protein [Longimicrobiales bacterium]